MQLKCCKKIDFEGYPNDNLEYPNQKKLLSQKQLNFAQLKYCKKMDSEGYHKNDLKYPNKKNCFFDLKINEISLYSAIMRNQNITKDWISMDTLIMT